MTTAVSSHGTSASTGTIDTPDTPDTPPPAGRSLSDLHLGTSGRVVGLLEDAASGPIIKRLSNLGFVPGRVVTPLRRAPLGDPVVYRVADYELCLRHHEARIVRVEAVTGADDGVESVSEVVTGADDGVESVSEVVTEADDGVESVSEAVTDSEDEGQRR
ncbi:ferrous iron transport protein A [Actinomyces viscosus]|uniref:FeoA domain n=1 Tax=Actinomyces viscosus TaxID=1656 RepID=A0A3S4V379_ACTVI|nr:FeoA family protein [Actinomyces viscosus]TFH51333.1 ferrous iron transport protein A [Actinomyces viscosus]VEI17060.1 FeoA domain [Actinomyces viscosus]